MTAPKSLRELLQRPETLLLPGVFDGVSARIAAQSGFEALYMTGFGVVASAFGLPDAGAATYTDMVDRVRYIASSANVPVLADGDTGYGGLLNVDRTVRGYIAAGASGIQLEDQEVPKRCGHTPGRRVVDIEDAVHKIKVAAAARNDADSDFVIVARTDARTAHGLDEALRRGEKFFNAGADVLFVESPESVEELRKIGETFRGKWLLANMIEGGRTPCLPATELAALGFKIGLYPLTGLLAGAAALASIYADLRRAGGSGSTTVPLMPFESMTGLMGFRQVWEFEKRWS
jgi:2-methylisocitrate lyase-like PEP mutase family enzyme